MTVLQAMHDYYSGQRYVALAGALVAVLYLLVAVAAYLRKTHLARSFAITIFLLAGFFMLPANVGYLFYLRPQTARIATTLAHSPLEFDASESEHLTKMMNGFHRSYRLDGTIALLGLLIAAIGFATRSSKVAGVGLAVTLCASTLLAGEVWSKQRALHYQQALTLIKHASPSS